MGNNKKLLSKLEKAKVWEKRLVDKAVEQIILSKAEDLINVQIEAALSGHIQSGQYLIDRTFGKARQNIGLDGGEEGAPIVFMPSVLVNKFKLLEPTKSKEEGKEGKDGDIIKIEEDKVEVSKKIDHSLPVYREVVSTE